MSPPPAWVGTMSPSANGVVDSPFAAVLVRDVGPMGCQARSRKG